MEDAIKNVLMTQEFYDWYRTKFDAFVCGETENGEEILEDIKKMFTVK
jgi:hypothetical protein